MPRTRSLAWSELKIGVLTIVAVVIAAVAIFLLTGSRGFPWQRYDLKTRFTSAAGLKPGSLVRVAGVEVGAVSSTELVGDEVEVTFQVNKAYRDRITTASTATLGSVSLLGESAVDITPAVRGTPIPPWGYVPAARAPAGMAELTGEAEQGISEISALIRDLRQGKGTAGKLLTDQALYDELHQFVTVANELTTGLQQGRGTLGQLLKNPATAQALQASLQNLEEVTKRLNAGEGSLGKLLTDDTFSRSLTAATGDLDTLLAKLNRGEGTAGKLITDPALFDQMKTLTDRLTEIATQLDQGQGTAGLLLKDRRLYENMNGVVSDLHTLIMNIEQNPRKYLNVRVSLF